MAELSTATTCASGNIWAAWAALTNHDTKGHSNVNGNRTKGQYRSCTGQHSAGFVRGKLTQVPRFCGAPVLPVEHSTICRDRDV
ncbi:unnamed protein product, partial [Mycena citricolor]